MEYYFYLRRDKTDNQTGVITIYCIQNDYGVFYGYSFCSPKDKFSKKKARMIAKARAKIKGHKYYCVYKTQCPLSQNELYEIGIWFLSKIDVPNWAISIAENANNEIILRRSK